MYGKIGQLKVKTRIYETIEDLIILLIKFQFSSQVRQAFRLLYISILNPQLQPQQPRPLYHL